MRRSMTRSWQGMAPRRHRFRLERLEARALYAADYVVQPPVVAPLVRDDALEMPAEISLLAPDAEIARPVPDEADPANQESRPIEEPLLISDDLHNGTEHDLPADEQDLPVDGSLPTHEELPAADEQSVVEDPSGKEEEFTDTPATEPPSGTVHDNDGQVKVELDDDLLILPGERTAAAPVMAPELDVLGARSEAFQTPAAVGVEELNAGLLESAVDEVHASGASFHYFDTRHEQGTSEASSLRRQSLGHLMEHDHFMALSLLAPQGSQTQRSAQQFVPQSTGASDAVAGEWNAKLAQHQASTEAMVNDSAIHFTSLPSLQRATQILATLDAEPLGPSLVAESAVMVALRREAHADREETSLEPGADGLANKTGRTFAAESQGWVKELLVMVSMMMALQPRTATVAKSADGKREKSQAPLRVRLQVKERFGL